MVKKLFISTLVLTLALSATLTLAQDSTKPAETEPAATTAPQPAKSALTAEAKLCTGVVDRVAQGETATFSPDVGEVFLWSRIEGADEPTHVLHKWYYKGEEMAAVELSIKGNSWRTWSSKKILPHWTGDWEVKIVDADDKLITKLSFMVE